MEDARNYIEFTQSRARELRGRELTPGEMATEFAKLDMNGRLEVLNSLDRDAKSGDAYSTARAAARQYHFEHLLRETHKRLKAIDR